MMTRALLSLVLFCAPVHADESKVTIGSGGTRITVGSYDHDGKAVLVVTEDDTVEIGKGYTIGTAIRELVKIQSADRERAVAECNAGWKAKLRLFYREMNEVRVPSVFAKRGTR